MLPNVATIDGRVFGQPRLHVTEYGRARLVGGETVWRGSDRRLQQVRGIVARIELDDTLRHHAGQHADEHQHRDGRDLRRHEEARQASFAAIA
jgi:hypothetical protein